MVVAEHVEPELGRAVAPGFLLGELNPRAAESAASKRLVDLDRPDPPVLGRRILLLSDPQDADRDAALNAATQAALDFDNATKSINKTSDKLDETLASGDKINFRSFSAARLRYTAARYDAESRLNMSVASVYELQVRKSNISAERHRKRSGKFFYGMLGAQLAVIIATFAIAARQRNFLWSLAAAAGLIAVSFAAYVYLYV